LLRSALDVRKAGALLGWKPEFTFENGLPQLIDWFKKENA